MNDYKKKLAEFCGVEDVGEVSDGYHTLNQLYHQRAILFACIVMQNKDRAWKTRKHECSACKSRIERIFTQTAENHFGYTD